MTKTLIDTIPRDNSCFFCAHAFIGVGGLLCGVFQQTILQPQAGDDCPMFEEAE